MGIVAPGLMPTSRMSFGKMERDMEHGNRQPSGVGHRKFNALVRFFEVAGILGFLDKDTWRTLFPPFKGWDIGCYYCDLHDRSVERGACGYGERRGWKKCGRVKEESNAPAQPQEL